MPRLQPVTRDSADEQTAHVLDDVQSKLGKVPNIVATMANSPAVATAYLGFSGALASGTLSPRLREQIALAVGEANSCDYCLAAHTALGRRAGLTKEETIAARQGQPDDDAERAAVDFARRIVRDRGFVGDDDVRHLRDAGYNDGQIAEIVANVALNLFTNYFNHVAGTEVDFPAAPQLPAAA